MMKQILTDVSEIYEMVGSNELFLVTSGKKILFPDLWLGLTYSWYNLYENVSKVSPVEKLSYAIAYELTNRVLN